MPTLVTDITAQNWQIGAGELGKIAQGVDDIAQCIGIILNTAPGSDLLRPGFGSALAEYLDQPLQIAQAGLKKVLTRDIERWEPRVKVVRIQADIADAATVNVEVVWRLLLGDVTGVATYSFTPGESGATPQPPVISFTNPTTTTISTAVDWQLSLDEFGSTVEGANEISQAIAIAVSNIPGTDVLRPLFGGALWEHVDTPLAQAGAVMGAAIRQAVEMWEPRAEITSVRYTYQAQPGELTLSGLIFEIGWRLRGDDVEGQTDLLLQLLNEGTTTTSANIIIRILAAESGEAITSEAGAYIEI